MINYIQYFGQRRSGTTWFSRMLKENFVIGDVQCGEKWGGKHSPEEFYRGLYDGTRYLPRTDTPESTLFLFMSRDIYSWLESMSRSPQGYRNSIPPAPVSIFIRRPYVSQNDRIVEGGRFINPIEMRNIKSAAFLDIHSKVENSELISYTDFISDPCGHIQRWSDEYGLKLKHGKPIWPAKESTHNIAAIYDGRINKFTKEDIEYVESYMDRDLEAQFGYEYE